MRVVVLTIVACMALVLRAVAAEAPVLEVTFEESEAIPGQPLSLRLSVLVPTWLPKPVVFPSFEVPNLLVRLPEGSTGPISKTIDGETWSGVTRHYRLSPMVPGPFNIPPQDVIVTYADPNDSSPVTTTLRTDPINFSGVLPEGAEGLDPFIAAESINLKQDISGPTEQLKPGDSVTRRVTAKIVGTSPMFLPRLLPEHLIDGVASYPDEPVLTEKQERGQLSGAREESVTLVAEGGGSGTVPAIELRWYNLGTKAIETASVDGFPLSVDGPPARTTESIDRRALAVGGVAAVVLATIVFFVIRYAVPRVRRWRAARKATWLASEGWAFQQLKAAIARRDYGATLAALDVWAERCPGVDPRRDLDITAALAQLGAARFGRSPSGDPANAWRRLGAAIGQARRAERRTVAATQALPPMNPRSVR